MRGRPSAAVLACIGVALMLGAVARSAAGPAPSFAAAKTYRTGKGPISVAVADLNGDGKRDLATANRTGSSISVLLNRGDGSFNAKHDYGTPKWPHKVVAADLNGDGKRDLVTANQLSPYGTSLSVLLNRGDGSFEARRDYGTPDGVFSHIAIADLNGDDKPDLATENNAASTVSVLLNNGDGSFLVRRDYATGRRPDSLAIGDVNGDGKPELVTANADADTVSVFVNRGDGSFEPKRDYATGRGHTPDLLTLADLDGDGKPDLVFAWSAGFAGISVLLNRGDGSFGARHDYLACWPCFDNSQDSGVDAVVIADLNGDSKPDLASRVVYELLHQDYRSVVSVFLNKGGGTFKAQRAYRTGSADVYGFSRQRLETSDLNGDGKPDLVTADAGLLVLVNRGDGSFPLQLDYPGGGSVASGDLNGDGKPDLMTVGSSSLRVLINTPGLCNVQRVDGMKLADAKRRLARVNCRVGKVTRVYTRAWKTWPKGHVISQKPKFGAVLHGGARVSLVVSRGRRR